MTRISAPRPIPHPLPAVTGSRFPLLMSKLYVRSVGDKKQSLPSHLPMHLSVSILDLQRLYIANRILGKLDPLPYEVL